MTQALKHGAKIETASRANDMLVKKLRKALNLQDHTFFNSDIGHIIEKLVAPSILHFAISMTNSNHAKSIQKVCELAGEDIGRECTETLLDIFQPIIEELGVDAAAFVNNNDVDDDE